MGEPGVLDCHRIVELYTDQNRVPFAPSLCWVSCKERERVPHQGANFHSSLVHYQNERKTIIRYDPTTLGAKAYRALARELLEIFSLDSHEEP